MYISATSENRGEVSGVASEIDLNVTQIIANVSATAKNVAMREATIKRRIRAPVLPRRSGANPAATIMPRVAPNDSHSAMSYITYGFTAIITASATKSDVILSGNAPTRNRSSAIMSMIPARTTEDANPTNAIYPIIQTIIIAERALRFILKAVSSFSSAAVIIARCIPLSANT